MGGKNNYQLRITNYELTVPGVGVEPTSLTRHHFKWCAYTNSAIRALGISAVRPGAELNRRIEILQISALPLGYQAVYLYLFINLHRSLAYYNFATLMPLGYQAVTLSYFSLSNSSIFCLFFSPRSISISIKGITFVCIFFLI